MFDDFAARLARAQGYVLKGREIVAAQQARVDDLRLQGRSTDIQERLLTTYASTLVIFEENLARVRAEV